MNKSKEIILIDVSLTGGRGPSKQALSFIEYLIENDIYYTVITDKGFSKKLSEIGIKPDYIVNTDLNDTEVKIIKKFQKVIEKIDYTFMVKFGARVAGPIASRKLRKPYFIVDGGLPDFLTNKESLYERLTFEKAEKILVTTQFNWEYPKRTNLNNIEVVAYNLSKQDLILIEKLTKLDKLSILDKYKNNIKGKIPTNRNDFIFNLLMTGDFLKNIKDRKTYGGWLTSRQYDSCVGFVRRFISDLTEITKKKVWIFVDKEILEITSDLFINNEKVIPLTFRKWGFETEVAMQAVADIIISRATNYQQYVALLCKGGSITSPVPADGYMDEDSAGIQYYKLGLTKLINYDDEKYIFKLINFINNKKRQSKIKSNLEDNLKFNFERNANRVLLELMNIKLIKH